MRSVRSRPSIPTRILLAFASVLLAFGIVAGASLVQHQRTAETLRLLHEAYVPLALAIGEAKASEAIVQNMLEYVLDERDARRTRQWLGSQRHVVPGRLDRARQAVERAVSLDPPPADRAALSEIGAALEQVQDAYEETEPLYVALFEALDRNQAARAAEIHAQIVRREAQLARQLLVSRNRVQARIEETSRSAAEQERRSVLEVAVLALLSLIAGAGVTFWAQRLLAPLARLHERVVAVARGDLTRGRLPPRRDDEIGRLTQEFERMVDAISARDHAVRELQQLQERIVASLRSAVVVLDADGVVRAVNQSALPVLGLGKDTIGRSIRDTALPSRLPHIEGAIQRVAEGGEPRTEEAVALPLPDGERHVDLQIAPFASFDASARRGVLLVADDVTDELATKQRLIQSERLAVMGKMAALVTHEVRNPLSSIALNVEVLADELGRAPAEVQAPLRAIQREVDRLTAITEEYLRLARLPAPRLELEDLGAVASEVARFLEREMRAAGCELIVEVAPDLPGVGADEAQIRQALLNLLRNAREAMPQGGPIVLSVAPREGGVEIAVRDRGEGIPEAKRARVFDLFYSTKERGTGLGLPLTQQIVLAHRGTIRCEDVPGGGTVFTMWFPRANTEPNEVQPNDHEQDTQRRAERGRDPRGEDRDRLPAQS